MTEPSFGLSSEARKAGWFSRRHQTSEPHRQAQANWAQKLKEKAIQVAKSTAQQIAAETRKLADKAREHTK